MGEPMAANLLKAGARLMVWNRTPEKAHALAAGGADVAADPAEVFASCDIVVSMLLNEAATDFVLMRHHSSFARQTNGCLLVNMATVSPAYSEGLEADVRAAGGRYVEVPVMGTRAPAEQGQLVALASGDDHDVDAIDPLLAPMCRQVIRCGSIGTALRLKLATNLLLIVNVVAMAEAAHFAKSSGVDLGLLSAALDSSPMASPILRLKMSKLLTRDFSRQGAVKVVLQNSNMVEQAAEERKIAVPLLDLSGRLYGEAISLGLGDEDMIAVVSAFEHRTAILNNS